MKKEKYFLREALKYAKGFSTDPSTQLGAILVDKSDVIVAYGANHFPRGVEERPERWERPIKYSYVEHAERNVIFHACRQGVKTTETTMYAPWYACSDCSRAIIQAGIKKVVGLKPRASERWHDSVKIGVEMLKESGVECHYIDAYYGIELLRDGKLEVF